MCDLHVLPNGRVFDPNHPRLFRLPPSKIAKTTIVNALVWSYVTLVNQTNLKGLNRQVEIYSFSD